LHDNPGALNTCTRPPARLPTGIQLTLVSRIFSSQFLLGPPARLIFLSRDTAACFWSAHFPCARPLSHHPWFEVRLRMSQHPRVYRFPVRSRLAPSNYLTSWLSRQVLVRSCQAAVPLSRTALDLHSSWPRTRTVSFSSVETLRRPLVCTLPLSAVVSIHC